MINISSFVSNIQLDTDASKITIHVDTHIIVTGTGNIDELEVEKSQAMALELVGEIQRLALEKGVKVEISRNVKITTLVIPEDEQPSSMISNYGSLLNNTISKVETPTGQIVPIPPSIIPPYIGGDSSFGGGGTTSPVRYTVIVDIDGNPSISTTNAKGKIMLPTNPTKIGYKFIGWNTQKDGNGTVVTADTVFRANTIVYAIFKQNQTVPKITGHTPLTNVTLDTDQNLTDIAALKASSKLPTAVELKYDGGTVSATITDWTGTYDGTTAGTYTLTAVYTLPVGYVQSATPEVVTVDVVVTDVQTIDNIGPLITAVDIYDEDGFGFFGDFVGDKLRITFTENIKNNSPILRAEHLENLLTFTAHDFPNIDGNNFTGGSLKIEIENNTLTVTLLSGTVNSPLQINDTVTFDSAVDLLEDFAGNKVNGILGTTIIINSFTP